MLHRWWPGLRPSLCSRGEPTRVRPRSTRAPASRRGADSVPPRGQDRDDRMLDDLVVKPGEPAQPRDAQPRRAPRRRRQDRRPLAGCSSSRPGSTSCTTGCGRRRSAASSSCSRGWTRRARTAPSGGSSPGSTRRAARSPTSRSPPTSALAHDYLWRVHNAMPARGILGVFNRSHYEDVVAARIIGVVDDEAVRAALPPHPGVRADAARRGHHDGQGVPPHLQGRAARSGSRSASTTPRRTGSSAGPTSRCGPGGTSTSECYEEAITATSTDWAPWHVVPADHKSVRDVAVAEALLDVFERLDPEIPDPEPGLEGLIVE